jgi:16S rRNA (cytosine967-C5)-methyltransferase
MAASPKAGQSVFDACSAPGGKAFMAAMLMGNSGEILAADIHENKLKRISDGASRLGVDIIKTAQADASIENPELYEKFDLVIADVPCSGLGIIRKKPEIRYKNLDEIKELPALQLKILKNVSRYVKPGGVLMYSTCTIIPEENEGVIKAFLNENSDFKAEKFNLPAQIGEAADGMLTLYPHIHGTDGFFMCKMRKA